MFFDLFFVAGRHSLCKGKKEVVRLTLAICQASLYSFVRHILEQLILRDNFSKFVLIVVVLICVDFVVFRRFLL